MSGFWGQTPDVLPPVKPGPHAHDDGMPNGYDDPGYLRALLDVALEDASAEPERATPAPAATERKEAIWSITEPWDAAEIPRRPWIARGYLMRGSVTVVSGPGSAGKSSLMVAWAAAASVGSSFRNFKLRGSARIATYNVEDDRDEQKRRFSAMFRRLGLPPDAFGDRLAILGPDGIGTLLTVARDGRLLVNTDAMEDLERFVIAFRPDVLMLDPFVELHDAEENDNTTVRSVMAKFRIMAARHRMAVVILHHARKGLGEPGDPDSLRGASSIVGAARVVLTVNVMTKEEAKTFGVADEKRRSYFRLDGAKSNYAPLEEAEWFERQEIRLENGDADEPGDGVAVVWPWKPPSTFADTTPAQINRILDVLAEPPAGWLYSASSAGANNSRWAGAVIIREIGCSEEQAKGMLRAWLKSGLLVNEEYRDDARRKTSTGLRVVHAKRPTE